MDNNKQKANRLINEKSPYLLQHAYDPVDWFPWCQEAFEMAKAEDKPIFLSIGYSTCHWCHVMAHESFEDDEVAELLNRDYVAIKVDKEERPDIDAVYMAVCQSINGQGGWPMTIIMTPDQKPFFAGTYLPKMKRYNLAGLIEILNAVTAEWKENRAEILKVSDEIVGYLNQSDKAQIKLGKGKTAGKNTLQKHVIHEAKDIFHQNFDPAYGGFGTSPKFPTPHNLMFLLRYYKFEKDEEALFMVETTLEHMYRGGIFDHIGYGFSRYSTDEKWLVPHFEKMLYDNALLAITYLEAYQITGKDLYKSVAEKIFKYILREMSNEEGGFYSAQDADSEGVEGKYYVFSPDELTELLGKENGEAFNQYFDVTQKGNFEGKSIPNLIKNKECLIRDEQIEKMIPFVYDYRLMRTELHKDDKILTAWNSLMIVAFAKAFKALEDNAYLKAAEKAAEFIIENLTSSGNKLYIRYRNRVAAGYGTLDEYAYFAWALTELYEANFDSYYLDYAMKLGSVMKKHFWDEEVGGFFLTGKDSEKLIYRPKETYDGATPSGNSVAGYVLMKLGKLTGNQAPKELGLKQLQFLYDQAVSYPAGHSFALMALMMELYGESFLCENMVCS